MMPRHLVMSIFNLTLHHIILQMVRTQPLKGLSFHLIGGIVILLLPTSTGIMLTVDILRSNWTGLNKTCPQTQNPVSLSLVTSQHFRSSDMWGTHLMLTL